MPPKRKAKDTATTKTSKKAKTETEEKDTATTTTSKKAKTETEQKGIQDVVATLKQAEDGKKNHKVDQHFPDKDDAKIYEDYDCILNQTNIGRNNNKFYIIQLIDKGGTYYTWNRWGRVGDVGQKGKNGPFETVDLAIKDFCKKFKSKTGAKWENRKTFNPINRKYAYVDVADEDEDEVDNKTPVEQKEKETVTSPCTLDTPTQALVKLIFDRDMFREVMTAFDIDVKRMPLGKLSKSQIAKGFECLDELEKAIEKNEHRRITDLTSKFYSLIPHDFGRKVPPVINSAEGLRLKIDMLLVLADIELAQSMQEEEKTDEVEDEVKPHLLDVKYNCLKCSLNLLDPKSDEFKILETYARGGNMENQYPKLKHIWKVNREGEGEKFSAHDEIANRKLLWHGTNVAVVAAILKSGLRIMPHSGGRVGRGIYFASDFRKSYAYVRRAGRRSIMFLNEVALGNEYLISKGNSGYVKAPAGYDSIIAKGWTEPDPSKDIQMDMEGKKVTVPQGSPVSQPEYDQKSSFYHSEYLVYKENQNRIRYLLMFE